MDTPIRPRKPDHGWTARKKGDSHRPVSAKVKVDVVINSNFDQPLLKRNACDLTWGIFSGWGSERMNITHWRLHDPAVNPE